MCKLVKTGKEAGWLAEDVWQDLLDEVQFGLGKCWAFSPESESEQISTEQKMKQSTKQKMKQRYYDWQKRKKQRDKLALEAKEKRRPDC